MITTLVIHDGPQGTITYLSGADRWEAFSPTGRYLGEFPTEALARRALTEAPADRRAAR
jgi:hypothetical protein